MSNFTQVLCRDVRVCFFAFLQPKDQASLRAVSKESSIDFNHAAQRGYVPVMICEEYVEDVNEIHQDGEDGNPKFHFAPGDQRNLFAPKDALKPGYKMQRSEKDKKATLIVNVAKMLGKGETKLKDYFLFGAQFKAVHFIGMENLEEVGQSCLYQARNLVCFTMSTPCPRLRSVGDCWLARCSALTVVSFRGCTALESVGLFWLYGCSTLKSASFDGCSALERVGNDWMFNCRTLEVADFGTCFSLKTVGVAWLIKCPSLRRVVLPAEHLLSDNDVQKLMKYLK